MKLREHRGGLSESMATVIEIAPTHEALVDAVRKAMPPGLWGDSSTRVVVSPYGFDARIGWDTHIVTIQGYGCFGFTDGPLPAPV